jgi:hypothetical protein
MAPTVAPSRSLRTVLLVVALVSLGWLAVLAARPSSAELLPTWLRWFGEPGSAITIVIVTAVILALCVLTFRAHGASGSGAVPVTVVAGLAATSAVLGLSSFWSCHDETHPVFFQPLIWTIELVKGGGSENDFTIEGRLCPAIVPDALWIAHLAGLSAILTAVAGAVVALFRTQVDRLRVSVASSVIAVLGIDDETRSMVSAIARTTLNRRSTLVVITGGPDDPGVQEARIQGGRVVSVDFSAPETLKSLSLWRNLDRLYLMSADPLTNRSWLDTITRALSAVGHRQRLPLTVRIDDPWQAEAWRAEQLGGSDTRWAADAVGKYEVTARRLLDSIISIATIDHVFVCGTSELTLALCADMTRRKLEHDYYSEPDEIPLPALTLVDEEADEYLRDHEFHRRQVGFVSTGPTIDAKSQAPVVSTLMRLIGESSGGNAAIFVDDRSRGQSDARSTGTRLAARFPTMPIYIWDNEAQTPDDPFSIVGRLRTYRLALDVPEGQAQDVWERAAKLIHQRYVASMGPDQNPPPSRLPWAELDEFYRDSNRRLVRNALWMVEQIAEHTWNTWGDPPTPLGANDMVGLTPLQQLARMGFDEDSAMKMAKAEHEDWCRYYRHNHWKYGPVRDDSRKIHNKLVDWPAVEADAGMLNSAVGSLAATLWSLRQLGYRSHPVWHRFTRIGTVTAEQQSAAWTWTSRSGQTMQADAGDWEVRADGETWSVRDNIFQASYEIVGGNQWRRRGTVSARAAQPGETIETLEGPTTAADGDWVVRGTDGEEWPVPADEFAQRYAEVDRQSDGQVSEDGS